MNHVINAWFSGNLQESDRNLIEKFESSPDASVTPAATSAASTYPVATSAASANASTATSSAVSAVAPFQLIFTSVVFGTIMFAQSSPQCLIF